MKCYRCTACDKWSHAVRMPKRHQRFVYEEPEDTSLIIEYDPGQYDHMNGHTMGGGYRIWCGPFEEFVLTPRAEYDRLMEQVESLTQEV